MDDQGLKERLASYPHPGWDDGIEVAAIPDAVLGDAIAAILKEHCCFPLPWREQDDYEGLLVTRIGDRYQGAWNFRDTAEEGDEPRFAEAVEDLSDLARAVKTILRYHFGRKSR